MFKRSVVLVVLLASAALAAEVVVFGDSWGALAGTQLQEMFTKRGVDIDVYNGAIGGTTARFWARDPDSLVDMVKENPDCKWVWLSIGGNDAIFELALGRPIETILEDAINNTRIFVDRLVEYDPTIQIVQFGYDIVNFEMSVGCRTAGKVLIPWCNTTACFNNEMFRLQYDYVEGVHEYYPESHVALNMLGTMQASQPDVIPGPYPNVDYFSPADLMRDCIHALPTGYTIIFDHMWEIYWKEQVAAAGKQ